MTLSVVLYKRRQKKCLKKNLPRCPSVGVEGFGLFAGVLPLPSQWRSCHLRYSTHDIYPGEGIDRCFKAALWHGQERPLVTLDKAGDYRINLRGATASKSTLDQPLHACHRLQQAASRRHNARAKGEENSLTKCSLPHVFTWTCWMLASHRFMCQKLSGCSVRGVDEV